MCVTLAVVPHVWVSSQYGYMGPPFMCLPNMGPHGSVTLWFVLQVMWSVALIWVPVYVSLIWVPLVMGLPSVVSVCARAVCIWVPNTHTCVIPIWAPRTGCVLLSYGSPIRVSPPPWFPCA